jgi:hypothetical protein
MRISLEYRVLGVLSLVLASCGDGRTAGSYGDYEEERVTVIGSADGTEEGAERITVSGPNGEGECVQVSSNLCVPAESTGEWCEREGGPFDVVIVDGQVVEVICYPPATSEDRPVEHIDGATQGDIDVAQTANRTVVVFNEETDGVPIVADLSIAGNNVSIYGNGADKTIIDGDVALDGNNVRLRGITITGDLIITNNHAAVVLCKVLGNVVLQGESTNGSVFVENDVFGNFVQSSNNNTITGNDVMGEWTIEGQNITCDANHAFADANQNQICEDEERGDLLACP